MVKMWTRLLLLLLLPSRTYGQEEPRLYPELFIATRNCDISYSSAVRRFKECYSETGSCSARASSARRCASVFERISCPPLQESMSRDLASVWSRYHLMTSATCDITLGVEEFQKCYDERLRPARNQCRFPPDSSLSSICSSDGLARVKSCYLRTAQTCDPEGHKATKVWLKYISDKVICGQGSGSGSGSAFDSFGNGGLSNSTKSSIHQFLIISLLTLSILLLY